MMHRPEARRQEPSLPDDDDDGDRDDDGDDVAI